MAFAACGSEDTPSMTLSEHVAEIATHMSDIRGMEEEHAAAVEDAADLDAAVALEGQHETEMTGHFDHLGEEITGLGECMDDADHMPDTTRMHQSHEDCMTEADVHAANMAAAADLSAALEEEARHQSAMADVLDNLEADLASLDAQNDAFHCQDSSGSHGH
jgi:hypothetical protein